MNRPKPVNRALRELIGKAHEADLRRELEKLAAEFERWRRGRIWSPWTSNLGPDVLAAIAIREGLVA